MSATYDIEYDQTPVFLTVTTPPQLTVLPNGQSRNVGSADPPFTFQLVGLQGNDTAQTAFTTQPTCTSTATVTSPLGFYPITCSGGVSSTYTIAYSDASMAISDVGVTVTVTADNKSRLAGAANPAFTFSLTGLQGNDTAQTAFTTQPTCTSAADTNSPAGTYPITCSGTISNNYNIAYTAGTLTVTGPPTLTVTAENKSSPWSARPTRRSPSG